MHESSAQAAFGIVATSDDLIRKPKEIANLLETGKRPNFSANQTQRLRSDPDALSRETQGHEVGPL